MVGNGEIGSGVGALALCQHPVPVCSSCHALAAGNLADIIIVLAFVGVRERKDGKVKLHAYLAQDVGKLHVPRCV